MTRDYGKMRELIESAKGRFCYVEFEKKDGTLRKMIIQPAKLKFEIKGDEASEEAKKRTEVRKANNPHLMPVWDVQAEGIRSVNFDTVRSIHVNGENYSYAASS